MVNVANHRTFASMVSSLRLCEIDCIAWIVGAIAAHGPANGVVPGFAGTTPGVCVPSFAHARRTLPAHPRLAAGSMPPVYCPSRMIFTSGSKMIRFTGLGLPF